MTTTAPFTPLERFADRTLARLFLGAVSRHAALPALSARRDGAWQALSYRDVDQMVARLAAALDALGVAAGDRVALLSENRPEWAVADYATLCLGAVTVPLYPTLPAAQVAPILRDAAARVAIASSAEQAEKLLAAAADASELAHLVLLDGPPAPGLARAAAERGVALHAYDALLAGAADDPAWRAALYKRATTVRPDDLATLIYTSGTTGAPKGVMLTHGNLASMIAATRQHGSLAVNAGETALSILPLSHVFERAADYYFFAHGVTIAFAESMQTVVRDIAEVRPHHLIAVPRLFEKIYAAATGAPGAKGRVARWAAAVGRRAVAARTRGRTPWPPTRAQLRLADRLVYARLRERLGGRLRTCICGGAPLAPEVAALFLAAGLAVYEGYGLTETSPVLAANKPGRVRLGSVGVPYPGVELRIGPEGEIQARGPSVSPGYWRNPEATAAAFTEDGWLRTGDVGHVDRDGFVHVTDRLKDLIVTAGGKNIAPQPLEQRVASSPWVAQAVLLGDRRPYPVMLVVPEFDALAAWAGEAGVEAPSRAALAAHPKVRALLEGEVERRLHDVARFERPKKVAVVDVELTVENELLTPSQKVRRRAVERRFRDVVDRLYDAGR